MRHRAGLLSVVVLCGLSGSASRIGRAEPPASPSGCPVPGPAKELVIGVIRHIVPIGAPIRRERAEVTADGVCTPSVECQRIERNKLDQLAAMLRALGPLRHDAAHASPHYGFRGITARWAGGECLFSDGSTQPLDERDRPKFNALYDAIVAAVIAAREARPQAPSRK